MSLILVAGFSITGSGGMGLVLNQFSSSAIVMG